jgi:hypothetical protein
MLRALRLPTMAANYADLATKATKAGLTHEAYLYEVVRSEQVQRDENRIARLLHRSELPLEKTFRTLRACDFSCAEVELLAEDGECRGVGAYLATYERSVLVVGLALDDLRPRPVQRGLVSALLFGSSTPLSWS